MICRALLVAWTLTCTGSLAAQPAAVGDLSQAEIVSNLRILHAEGRYAEGAALAREAIALSPAAPELHYLLGAMLGSADDHLGAAEAFRAELERQPDHAESTRGLATAYAALGRPGEAIPLFERYLELGGDDPRAILALARQLVLGDRFADAERRLDEASRAGLPEAEVERGLLLRRRGDLEASAAAFRRALADDPDDPTALFNLGQVLLRLGLSEEGRAVLARHAAAAPRRDRLEYLQRSSRLTGATAGNFLGLSAEQARAGDSAAALESLREAARRAPGDPEIALALAASLLESGALDAARGWAVRALLATPESSRAHLVLGLIRLRAGEVDAARAAFERSRDLAAWGGEQHRLVGEAELDRGAYAEAEQAFSAALERTPDSPAAARGLARARMARGDWPGAESASRRSLGADPADTEALGLLAIALAGGGRTTEARAELERYVATQRAELAIAGPEALLSRFARLPGAQWAAHLLWELLLPAPGGEAPPN